MKQKEQFEQEEDKSLKIVFFSIAIWALACVICYCLLVLTESVYLDENEPHSIEAAERK